MSSKYPVVIVVLVCIFVLVALLLYQDTVHSSSSYWSTIQDKFSPSIGNSKDHELATRLGRLVESLGLDLTREDLLSDRIFLQTLQQIEDYRLRMQDDPIETIEVAEPQEEEEEEELKDSSSSLPRWCYSTKPVDENGTRWVLWDVFPYKDNRYVVIQGPEVYRVTFQCRFAHPLLGIQAQRIAASPVYPDLAHFAIRCPLPTVFTELLRARNATNLTVSLISENVTFDDLPIVPPPNTQHFVSAYTMFRSPAARIPEWIEYHRMMGVEHFYFYDHLWEEETDLILSPYLERGLVTIVRWRFALNDTWFNSIQSISMNNALWKFGAYNKWMLYIDVDEYLVPQQTNETSIVPLLKEFENASAAIGALRVRSVIFNDIYSKLQLRTPPGLLIEQFVYRESIPNQNDRQKLLLRPNSVPAMQNVHGLSYGPVMEEIPTNRLLLYHYWADGRSTQVPMIFDSTAVRFVPKLKTKLFRLSVLKKKKKKTKL